MATERLPLRKTRDILRVRWALGRSTRDAVASLGRGPAGGADATLAGVEERHIRQVVERCQHNVTQAAKLLGIDRVTLHNKLKRYGMARPQ